MRWSRRRHARARKQLRLVIAAYTQALTACRRAGTIDDSGAFSSAMKRLESRIPVAVFHQGVRAGVFERTLDDAWAQKSAPSARGEGQCRESLIRRRLLQERPLQARSQQV
jgi:hypothetical protein